ncbi:uncharacterized protein LOC131929639 [Physella acuta]|uniref:uncharacterized protein LOC131929639 n=1 Tax=Physella acuta TaxID=109671 RepID=UPI0027DE6E6A|nr:uncharacterized protein LOC131929639 [Physella acuta]
MDLRIFVLLIGVVSVVSECDPPPCRGSNIPGFCTNVFDVVTAGTSDYEHLFPVSQTGCNQTEIRKQNCCPKANKYECTSARSDCLPLFWYKDSICMVVCPKNITYTVCTCDYCIPDCTLNEWCTLQSSRCTPSCGRLWNVEVYCIHPRSDLPSFMTSLNLCLATACHCIPKTDATGGV